MEQVPILTMVSFAGFEPSVGPFFLDGFVQYLSKMPSTIHRCRDCWTDAARTPLATCQRLDSTLVQRLPTFLEYFDNLHWKDLPLAS